MRKEEELYLEKVLETAKERLNELYGKMDDNVRDLESMNDYFWESYTEFDEYGYEMYDNRMALKTRLTQQEEYQKDRRKYEKMLDAPYFGRVDFCYDGEEEPEVYYVGVGNLAKVRASHPLVYDWRAPVCALFYDYDQGPAAFEAPIGIQTGQITSKRMYKIQRGKLIYALETDMNIDDEILQQALAEKADAKLKSIVTTIQKEQNSIIRDMKHRVMVVQGCAGSGKTSVALHRIAYLLYHNRSSLKAAQILVLSPNGIFGDYISRILPELGEENICEMTFDDYAYKELAEYGEAEDRFDEIEAVLAGKDDSRTQYQLSKQFMQELDGFILELEWDIVDLKDFKYKKVSMTDTEISRLFYEKLCDVPILSRMDKIADYVIDQQETLQNSDMEDEEKEMVHEKMNRMYRTRDILELYNEFLAASGEQGEFLDGVRIPYKDVYPLLYLKYSISEMPQRRKVKHLVIDEMQDYSYLQYSILQKMFDCPVTILGDCMQTMGSRQSDVRKFLHQIYGKEIYLVQMNKSYRSTNEIMEYARSILPEHEATECVERHGTIPMMKECTDYGSMIQEVASSLEKEKEYQTLAILCMNQQSADMIAAELEQKLIAVTLLNKDSMKFNTGITVMPFYLAKGLEFDIVYVTDVQDYQSDFQKQAMYINATRALHELRLFSIKERNYKNETKSY